MALFSQRCGYISAQQAFRREDASHQLRTALWNVLNLHLWSQWEEYSRGWTQISKCINALVQRVWLDFLKYDVDALPRFQDRGSRSAYDVFKHYFFECAWYELFDFIEFLAKDQGGCISSKIEKLLNEMLERENSAYRLVGREVVEITDKHQIAAIQKALEVPVPPVQTHLSAALAMLSDKISPDYRNSIKESISAVEAACRAISATPKATLGDALKKIPGLHPALSKAFSSLYGYTNDAHGIRHALLEEPRLTKVDATFMLVACSAFIGFLHGKSKT
jgi:hypothetical protein